MKNYFFTLFVRFFVAFSGFFVFIISSKLYGAEGRGVIGFGTSIVSLFGLLLSFNLGRSFLFETKSNENLKQKLLPNYLAIHYLLIIAGIFISALFWYFNANARVIIDSKAMMAFLILVPFYVWSVNGSSIYATLNKTTKQDFVIFFQRVILVVVTLLIFKLNIQDIRVFLFIYALVLFLGTVTEMGFLGSPLKGFSQIHNIGRYISDSKYVHVDYLAFNLYPLILMVFSGLFLKLTELGKLNFLIQLVNFIFILSIVASIRMKNYVAAKGVIQYIESIKKLLLFTLIVSLISIIVIFAFLNTPFFSEHFSSFGDVLIYFMIISLAVPGYIAYQFMYPILIEYNQIHLSMKINLLILIILVSLTHPILKLYGLVGGVSLFALFYLLVLLAQLYIYKKLRPMLISN
jgi:O-antigen/teichoic acid export membrane protein